METSSTFKKIIKERQEAVSCLRESEEKCRVILDEMQDAYFEVDLEGNFTFANKALCQALGYSHEEITGMSYHSIVLVEEANNLYKAFNAVYRQSQPRAIIAYRAVRKDGSMGDVEVMVSPIKDKLGEVVGFRCVGRDITERKWAEDALKKSEAQYRLLAEHTSDFIWLMDMKLKNIYVSPSVIKRTGFTEQEMIELPVERHMTEGSLKVAAGIFLEYIPRLEADPNYNPTTAFEIEYICKDGTTFWAENTFSLIRDENGRAVSILGEAREITERRISAEKLMKSYQSMKKTLNDTIDTMVKIVEMRDPYTAGHQQKVADLATAIATEMRLEETRIDQLRIAARIHDIGKMYIPSDILSKPGKLTAMELGLIQTHAKLGYDIVKDIDFPCNIAKAVLQHHERLDGSGYPNQLKGEEMVMEAKILAVADIVEAMASHRPYRPAMGIDKALEEISKNKGKLYDPDVVDICVGLFSNGRFAFKSVSLATWT